ncbi:hypothetical protein [Agrobacterium larrymoorei]|uniref:Uncharacterized protein n=1 Tax=Agrobacterium larrymoorei TaxID=160699 RepID=A0ABU0UDY4_9HYPH|nr:hypothetical protein [Agrobacterium larrymoorei]MDQ1183148.1 hypothetical protein [Agrobacterium larrymoorei]
MAAKQEEKIDRVDAPKTCFVIMPISDVDGYPAGHFNEVYKQLIEPAVTSAGYACSLATTSNSAHMIQLEVVTKVATADLCICDLSNNNPNVLFEYGIRQAFDKPTVLIKDDKTRRIFDLSGFRDIEYDHTLRIANTLAARDSIRAAILDTVMGSTDEDQIFSLVKLMKLTKAALPSGEVTKDDARFTLLEKKLDSIAISLSHQRSMVGPGAVVPISKGRSGAVATISGDNRWEIRFSDDSVLLIDLKARKLEKYEDVPSLEKSEFWSGLDNTAKQNILSMISKHSPDVIPF